MKVKICCITSFEEAQMAMNVGATALGLVGQMPSGPGIISDEKIAEIASRIPENIDTFLLTSKTSAEEIVDHHQKVNTTTIQIVDKLDDGSYADIRNAIGNVKLVQVIHVIDEWALDAAAAVAHHVDGILLDSGNPNKKIKELGGTGRTHNWDISSKIVKMVNVPVYLAGGLNPFNVVEAIERVQPDGVDLCSGVRTDGRLDEWKLNAFFKELNK